VLSRKFFMSLGLTVQLSNRASQRNQVSERQHQAEANQRSDMMPLGQPTGKEYAPNLCEYSNDKA